MRVPSPHISQEAPTNSRSTIAGKWYASVHELDGDEFGNKPQQRNTLGGFLKGNHVLMNKTVNLEELASQRDNIPTPSISSTQDMEQAISRFSREQEQSLQSFPEDETRLDSEGIFNETLEERANGRYEAYNPRTGCEGERDPAPPPFEFTEDDVISSAFDCVGPRRRTVPKSLADESLASRSDYGRLGKAQERYLVNGASSAAKTKATVANTIATRQSTTVQTINKPSSFLDLLNPSFLQRTCTPPIDSVLSEDGKKAETSLWSYLDPNDDLVYYDDHNLLSSFSSSDGVVRHRRRGKKTDNIQTITTDTQQPTSSPLREAYEDLMFINRESGNHNCSNNDIGQQKQQVRAEKSHSRSKYTDSPVKSSSGHRTSTPTTIGERSSYTQSTASRTTPDHSTEGHMTPSTIHDDLWRGESSKTVKRVNESPRTVTRLNPRMRQSAERNTRVIAHRGQDPKNYTQSTASRTTPDPSTEGRMTPSTIHDDLWRGESSKTVQTVNESPRTVNSDTPRMRQSAERNTRVIAHQGLDPKTVSCDPTPRVRVTVTSSTNTNTNTESSLQKSSERKRVGSDSRRHSKGREEVPVTPKSRSSSRGRKRGENVYPNEVADAYRAEKEAARTGKLRSRSKDPQRSPRTPKKDGYETTAAFSSKQKEESIRNTPTTPKRESKHRREKNSSNHREDRSDEHIEQGILSFTPDFYMLEALGREITGVPIGLSTQQGLPTINLADGDDTHVSKLSSVDSSTKKKLNRVMSRSMKNVQILQQFEEQTNRKRIPQHLPGAPDSWSSDGLNSIDVVEFANCLRNVERKMGFRLGSEKPKGNGCLDNTSATSESSNLTPHVAPHEAFKKPIPTREDVDGHYMYVAYSRFGEEARAVLQLCEHQSPPTPDRRNGEVLVKVLTSTISRTDCEIRRGEWSDVRLSPYIIPGTAFVGIIHHTEKKSAFSSFKPGDSVMALVKSGCNARYMCISRDQLVKVPPKVDPDLAVCLAETYFTAFQALHLGQRTSTRYRDNALQGRSFLIMGGYSSLGRALMELSLAGGADFCYALSKEKQFSAISRLGAIPLSKDPQDWLTLIGKQIGTIITVKDDGLYTEQVTKEHLKTLNNEGRVIVIGQPGVDNAFQISSPSVSKLICKSHRNKLSERSQCYNAFDSLASDPKQSKKDLEHLLALLEQGRLAPEVLERIPLSKVAKAQRIVESKRMSGHIVCTPWTKENLKH